MRILIHEDGLVRFATEKYVGPNNSNLKNLYMHLTNYSINKGSDNFVFNNESE
jgi:tubulin polyglutamylase TTLL6/13